MAGRLPVRAVRGCCVPDVPVTAPTADRRRVRPVRVLGLTLTPPWSNAILRADKRIENRKWKPSFLGGDWLALHGGRTYGKPENLIGYAVTWYYICQNAPHLAQVCPPPSPVGINLKGEYEFDRRECVRLGIALKEHLVTGIFGVCKVKSTIHIPKDAMPVLTDKWYDPGQVGWKLTDVVLWSDTIEVSGKQGLWPVEDTEIANPLSQIKQRYFLQTGKEMLP